jgi:hypothetical protein
LVAGVVERGKLRLRDGDRLGEGQVVAWQTCRPASVYVSVVLLFIEHALDETLAVGKLATSNQH